MRGRGGSIFYHQGVHVKAEINIDMDKPCSVCGQMGALPAGLCIGCAADAAFNPEKLMSEALALSAKQINNLLLEHLAQIHRAYVQSEDGKLSIGVSIELAPSNEMPNTIVLRSKINFIESRVRDEKTARVTAQEKLGL